MTDPNIIVGKFTKGDHKAYRIIFDELYMPLTMYAFSLLDDKQEVEDIVQNAFIKLWEESNGFDSIIAIKSYLYKVVRNSAFNILKHNKIKNKYSEVIGREVDIEYDPIEDIIRHEVYSQVMEVFEELPSACKNVYSMSINGYKHQEISEKLNISVNTVKKQKNRANKYLKEKLKNLLVILIGF